MKRSPYYGQFHEDKIIWRILDKKKEGFYIDIGAADGIDFSNTYYFEKIGWKGICVEPYPKLYSKLVNNRPNSICINCAVSDSMGEAELYLHNNRYFNTIEKVEDESKYGKILVKKRTLEDIMKEHNVNKEFDLLSIDAEGSDFKIIKSFSLEKYKPNIILVECGNYTVKNNIYKYLSRRNYSVVYQRKQNLFFRRINAEG